MSSSPARKAPDGPAEFARHTELLLACTPYLHVTAVARLCVSSKELRGACQAVAQQQFPRILTELLWELADGDKDDASQAAALSWLCGMAGRAEVAAASQHCLDQGCHKNGLKEEGVRLLATHGARATCQMVFDAARRGVHGAEVWLRAGAVDDAPDLLLWTSMGDDKRLEDLLYNANQLPPQQQLLDALQLAANMISNGCEAGYELLDALLFPPRSLSSGASPHARQQQLLALVPAADLERLLLATIRLDDDAGAEMATDLCKIPAAGELSGAAVLDLLEAAVKTRGDPDLVSALGRLLGAAEMPLDKVAGLLPGGERWEWLCSDEVLSALLEMPRVQQAITADVADALLRFAVESDLADDASMVEVISDSVAAGLVSTQGLAAAMERCWKG